MRKISKILMVLLSTTSVFAEAAKEKTSSAPARQQLLNLGYGFVLARAIHVTADLKIADALQERPLTSADLAKRLKVNEQALSRLMRVLVSHHVFSQDKKGRFHLTKFSKLLCSDHPQSVRAALAKELDKRRWEAFGQLEDSIKSGKPSFEVIYQESFYDYLKNNPEAMELFNKGMGNFSEEEDQDIATVYPFSEVQKVVDVGGSEGGLLAQILLKHSHVKGVLFDLPATVENPKYLKGHKSLDGRYEQVGGDFFKEVPQGGDVYVIKRVIHNWDDQKSVEILKNCSKAMPDSGRILVIDTIIPEGHEKSLLKDADLMAMTIIGGLERNLEEFKNLFKEAGLELVKVHPTSTRVSILELKKA